MRHAILTLAAALAPSAAALGAQQTTYASRAAFVAALAHGPTTITFDGVVPSTSTHIPAPPVIGGVGFDSPNGSALSVVAYSNAFVSLPSWPNLIVHDVTTGATVRMDFGGTTTAFALDYGVGWTMPVGGTYTFTLWRGASSVFTTSTTQQAPWGAVDFFGVTSAVPFDAVTVASSQDALIDDVAFGDVTPLVATPEPATWTLLGAGVVVLALGRRARAAGR